MDIYKLLDIPRYANCPNCWTRSRVDQAVYLHGDICTVSKVASGVWKICLRAPTLQVAPAPKSLKDVFRKWSCIWLWDDIKWQGDAHWLRESIRNEQCIVVADGSYMPHIRTDLCSTAFFFECTVSCSRLVGSFAEFLTALNAYRGKLLGLMAVHLILLIINELDPTLAGNVRVYLDCKGALDKVGGLPPGRLPAKCNHSDILKNILVNCAKLSFAVVFEHIEAHQDDPMEFQHLLQPAQLNCAVDASAK
jgi:hypothetical protein